MADFNFTMRMDNTTNAISAASHVKSTLEARWKGYINATEAADIIKGLISEYGDKDVTRAIDEVTRIIDNCFGMIN